MIQLLLHDSWSLLDDFLQFLQVGRLSCNAALSAAYLYHYYIYHPPINFWAIQRATLCHVVQN